MLPLAMRIATGVKWEHVAFNELWKNAVSAMVVDGVSAHSMHGGPLVLTILTQDLKFFA